MIARIIDNRWIQLDQLTPNMHDEIDMHFSVMDPNFKYIEDSLEQSWDGVYHKYQRGTQKLSRAFLKELLLFCKAKNFPIDVRDARGTPTYPMFTEDDIKDDILPGITLLPHQLRGLAACLNPLNEIGIHHQMTGSGKTELMCAIAKLLNCPTIIIAEETVVIDQIRERLQLRCVVDDVGVFYAGKTPDDQMVCVGSLASIIPPPKVPPRRKNEKSETYERKLAAHKTRLKNSKKYQRLLKNAELLMIDECDRCVNKQYKKLVRRMADCRYVYGFTGTMPNRDDDPLEYWHLKEILGNIISRASRRELEKIGRIIPVKYISIAFGDPSKKNNKAAFDIAVKQWIEENDEFHNKIKSIVESFPNDNFLILLENIQLGVALQDKLPYAEFIHGKTRQKKRKEVLERFASRDLQVLIGSKILKRGLDIKGGIDNVILCASSAKNSEIEQKIGRAVRINDRGWARVFDFLFVCNKYLYRHSRARLRRILELGYETHVSTPKAVLDGQKVMKRGFNISKYF